MVPQNIPTPKQHIMVAMRVAYGTLAIQSLHMFPEHKKYIIYIIYCRKLFLFVEAKIAKISFCLIMFRLNPQITL
jgi:hypothetical protein